MKELTVDRCRKQILRIKKCISEGYVSINERDYLQALEIALPILELQERGEGEWVDWGGGDCPVRSGKRVHVKFASGDEDIGRAEFFVWSKGAQSYGVIAYRIIPEQPTNQNGGAL